MTLTKVEGLLEEGKQTGRTVYDAEGNHLKVKKGQGGKLEGRWEQLVPGKTYEFEMGEYKGFPFVADFKEVATPPQDLHAEPTPRENIGTKDQTAIKAITDLWIAGKLSDTSVEVEMCRQWLRFRFPWPDSDIPKIGMPMPKVSTPTSPLVKAAVEMGAVVSEADVLSVKDREFKNAGDFLMEVYKERGYTKTKVEKLIGKPINQVTDLTGAWVYLATMKEEEDEEIASKKINEKNTTI